MFSQPKATHCTHKTMNKHVLDARVGRDDDAEALPAREVRNKRNEIDLGRAVRGRELGDDEPPRRAGFDLVDVRPHLGGANAALQRHMRAQQLAQRRVPAAQAKKRQA